MQMLAPPIKLKLRTSNGAPGAAREAASCDVAHGRQIRPTEPSALAQKFVLGIAYRALEAVRYKASIPSEAETQLSMLRSLRATPTSPRNAALASLTQWMGRERAGEGARVHAVCHNEVDTPLLRTGFAIRGLDPNTAMADLDYSVPLVRLARPEDIAHVVLFLASDAARYICGALVEVNGGKAVA
ncbi:SDR family oxidoreductase [Mesorhizobium sp. M0478]|uniref:SDR family oxidoreductase n=1 Tax=Mesorhizobium sp. M0478 TaxID=2956947 RepID=UPI003338A5D4